MDRILVADDGLAVALCVIEVTVDLAKKTGAELSAITVVDPSEYRQTEITMSTGVADRCASLCSENPNREAI